MTNIDPLVVVEDNNQGKRDQTKAELRKQEKLERLSHRVRTIAGGVLKTQLGREPGETECKEKGFFHTNFLKNRNVQVWFWEEVAFCRITIFKSGVIRCSTTNLPTFGSVVPQKLWKQANEEKLSDVAEESEAVNPEDEEGYLGL